MAVCDVNAGGGGTGADAWTRRAIPTTAMLLDPAVRRVDITLPHHLHYAGGEGGAGAGKHVLVEKPMAATRQECRELIEAGRARRARLPSAENTRFVTAYIEAGTWCATARWARRG